MTPNYAASQITNFSHHRLKLGRPASQITNLSETGGAIADTGSHVKASGSDLYKIIPGQRSTEEVSISLPVLLLLRPNHSASNTKGQPHSTAFPVRPTKTIRRGQNTEVTKTGIPFETYMFVLLLKSTLISTSSQSYSYKPVVPNFFLLCTYLF